MQVLIIEDEPLAATRLESMIKILRPDFNVVAKIDSVKQTVNWLKSNQPNLIFMDIQLADGLSFEIFEQTKVNAPVIFTTAYDEYALKAFKVNSIDYILKPIDQAELNNALTKLETLVSPLASQAILNNISQAMMALTKKYKERFVVKVGEHLKSVEVMDVLFFFSLEKTTFAQTRDGRKHILDFTLEELEDMIDPGRFFRINRKYLVAAQAIQDMISYTNSRLKLVLKTSDDNDVIVARERVQEFKEWLDR